MPHGDDLELVVDARAELGEGPLWDPAARRLYWVDILGGRLHAFDPASGRDRAWEMGSQVSTVVPRRSGGLVLALRDRLASFDPATGAAPVLLARPPEHPAGNRFNDGKCDPAGDFWVGTKADDNAPGAGMLWRFAADGTFTAMLRGATIANGLAWDASRGRFYFIDSPTRTVVAYPYEPGAAALGPARVVVACGPDDGYPDGMTIDEEGMLWVAQWGSQQVIRWDPDRGVALRRIRLPVAQPSSCAFGGDRLDRLYITSAREHLDAAQLAAQPLAGGLFAVDPGVRGRPAYGFAG